MASQLLERPRSVAATTDAHATRLIARGVGVLGLLGIALVHLLDLPGKIHETPYLGVAYIGLIAASVVAAGWLAVRDDRRAWASTGFIAAVTLAGYAVNRTVGMPHAMDDVGNWLEPLGLASLFIEAIVALTAFAALWSAALQT